MLLVGQRNEKARVRCRLVLIASALIAVSGSHAQAITASDQVKEFLVSHSWIFQTKTVTHGDGLRTPGEPCLEHRLTFSQPDSLLVVCDNQQTQKIEWRLLTSTASDDWILDLRGGAFGYGKQFDVNIHYSDGHLYLVEHRLGRLEDKQVYIYAHD